MSPGEKPQNQTGVGCSVLGLAGMCQARALVAVYYFEYRCEFLQLVKFFLTTSPEEVYHSSLGSILFVVLAFGQLIKQTRASFLDQG